MEEMGNLLVEGNGKGNSAIILYMASGIIGAIVLFVLANMAGEWTHFYGRQLTPEGRSMLQFLFFALGAVVGILEILGGIAISKTVIRVYENGISGKGISKWFYLGDVRSFDFMLTYDHISVDVNGGTINVHGPGIHYKVYVSNGLEIQQIIHKHKQKLAKKSD